MPLSRNQPIATQLSAARELTDGGLVVRSELEEHHLIGRDQRAGDERRIVVAQFREPPRNRIDIGSRHTRPIALHEESGHAPNRKCAPRAALDARP